jgi:hypothetical protein
VTGFVLDSSLALAWCFEDEASPVGALLERLRKGLPPATADAALATAATRIDCSVLL